MNTNKELYKLFRILFILSLYAIVDNNILISMLRESNFSMTKIFQWYMQYLLIVCYKGYILLLCQSSKLIRQDFNM